MKRLINIDNGARLTNTCGITNASAELYGRPALSELLHSAKHTMSDVQSTGVGGKPMAMLPVVSGVAGYTLVSR